MIENNTIVTVLNRGTSSVGYSIPDLSIDRFYGVGERKEVTAEEIRKLSYSNGGLYLLKHNLIINNEELIREILGEVEYEYFYSKDDVKHILEKGSVAQLQDCIEFAPKGVKDLVKQVAIEIELNDVKKRTVIKEMLGFDLTKHLELLSDVIEEESAIAQSTANTKRRAAPPVNTAPKYKVVTK